MERLSRLNARLHTLGEFQELVRAMRSMAAHHVQQSQSALAGTRKHAQTIEHSIAVVASQLSRTQADFEPQPRKGPEVVIVIGSQHGFVGAFNERLLERAKGLAGEAELALLGRRVEIRARETEVDCAWSIPAASDVNGVLGVARQVMMRIEDARGVRLVFSKRRKGGGLEVVDKTLTPLVLDELEPPQTQDPLVHLSPGELLENLSVEYVFAELTDGIVESLASENEARLRLMQSADETIAERLKLLKRRMRRVRQEYITSELFDVIIGADAVASVDEC